MQTTMTINSPRKGLRTLMLLAAVTLATASQAQILSYTTATDGSLNSVAANATGTALSRVNGATAPGSPCPTGFSCTSFTSTTTYSTTLAAVEVSVSPASGYSLSITGFSADMRRSGTGPASVRYAYSTDGGTTWTDQGSNQAPDNASCGTTTTGTWSTTITVNYPSTLKFRAYGFNASSTAGTFQLQNLNINGSVTASCGVPSGLSAGSITNTTATLSWGTVSGATSYNIQYRQVGTGTWTSTTSSTTSKAITGLTAATNYEFQVQSVCSGGNSAFSSSFDFTTTGSGGSGTIVSYTTATDGSLNAVAANATGTSLSRVNGDNAPGSPCPTGFSCTSFSSTTTYSSSLAAVEVTATPASGYQLSVTGFSADMRRSGTGPASVRYAYSTDGGTTWTDQGSNQSPDNASCGTTTTGTWTTSVTVSYPASLKFRVYGFNASSTAGTFQLQNLNINGSVTTSGGGGGGGGTLNPKFKIYFNNPVDTTVSTGVYAQYLNHCMADTLIAYIKRAKYSIDIAQYEYNQQTGFSNIANAVDTAYAHGVTVRWIYDSTVNNSGLSYLNSGIHTLSSPAAGTISPCSKAYSIMHDKIIIIDANSTNANDAYVLMGSPDWTTTQLNSDFNNEVIIQDSALAHVYTNEFNMMWGSTTATPNASAALWGPCKTNLGRHSFNINGTTVELYFTPSDSTNAHILSTIATANTDMYFGMYTFSDVPDASALNTAKAAGVTVDGVVDQFSNSYAAYDTLVNDLDTNHVKEYTGGYIYHNKYLIVDPSNTCSDPVVLTGSHNWTASADKENDENTIIIHDATIANIYYQAFKKDFNTLFGSLSHISVGGGCGTTYHRMAEEEVMTATSSSMENVVIFPNPSTNAFTIRYDLSTARSITISVENMMGQQVEVIAANEAQDAGAHIASFAPSVPGIYFIRMSDGEHTGVYKVVKL